MAGTQPKKRRLAIVSLALGALVASAAIASNAAAGPTDVDHANAEQAVRHGPIGWETYRNPERLAEIGTDARAKQFSSFDRAGGNNDGFDPGTYSCLQTTAAGECVIAEQTGAGEVSAIWFTRDNGNVTATGNIRIELDGTTVVDAPLQDVVDGGLGAPFVYPLVANAEQSSGGVYIKVPMTYQNSMRIIVQHNPRFYHVTYREFASAEGVPTFDPADPANDVIDKLNAAGTADPKPEQPNPETITEPIDIPAGETATLASTSGSGALTQLALAIPQLEPQGSDAILRNVRVRISFDGERTVDSPLGEFFGSGLGLYAVRSLMFGIDPQAKTLSSWWLMPYAESAKVELVNNSDAAISGEATIGTSTAAKWGEDLAAGRTGYFRSTSVEEEATFGKDHLLLDTTGQGRVVGVTQTVQGLIPSGNRRNYLEGDERVYVDGSSSPDLHGTGTEDFYEGGWYFSRGTFNAPMNGNPIHEDRTGGCQEDCTGLYRLLLSEGIDFSSRVKFSIEHGPANDAAAVVGTTTYWYGQPNNELAWTDSVDVGNTQSENAHAYTSDDPGEVTTSRSRFEGHDGAAETVELDGRATSAEVSFDVAVAQNNEGVVLRRTSDQTRAYQAAEVSVDGEPAGTWTQALGNPNQHWLDDTYRLPASSTSGKQTLTITLTPLDGSPAWHAAAYNALSRVPNATDGGAPKQVTGLAATAAGSSDTAINLTWRPARDDIYAPQYEVHASQTADFTPNDQTLVARARTPGFTHGDLDVGQTWYFKVRAVDATGQTGPVSGEVSATTGSTRRIEAESLLPAADSTAPVEAQPNCCGVTWSGDAQLWFRPESAGQTVTVEFDVATAGTYAISALQTIAPDYGSNVLRLDDQQIGTAFDGYNAGSVATRDVGYGTHQLDAGTHTLTLEVTGKAGASSGFYAGLDYLQLALTDGAAG